MDPCYRSRVSEPPDRLPARLRRTLEVVYGVEGVTGARVWEWEDRVAVGVRPSAVTTEPDLLRRVEAAVSALRRPGETWEFGILAEDEPPDEGALDA